MLSARSGLLELVAPSVCPACDRPRRPGELLLCPLCARGLQPLAWLDGIPTALAYRGTGMELVRRFKFDGRRDALAVLIESLLARLRAVEFDMVVPVPRHPLRVRELGNDPVFVLARALCRGTGWELDDSVLRRTRATPPQTGLDPAARRRNVAGSFRAKHDALRGRRVLLLDDVATTGATLREAARVLGRDARPRRLLCCALAGTPALARGAGSAL